MNLMLKWAWAAALADLGLFTATWLLSTSEAIFFVIFLLHAVFCSVIASVVYLMLPRKHQTPRIPVWILIFNFTFIAPVLGAICLLLVTQLTLRRVQNFDVLATPQALDLPEYNISTRKETALSSQSAVRSRLQNNVPDAIRMNSMITLQSIPGRVANPILENLLADSTDDIRLIAFGMLDAEEKKISQLIHQERQNLTQSLTTEQRYTCLRHIAELHWELVYASLTQGDLRRHTLRDAMSYLTQALELNHPIDSGILFLKGRILLAQGKHAEAKTEFIYAGTLGHPETSTLPYLAEIAYLERQFEVIPNFTGRLAQLNMASRSRAIIDFWNHHEAPDFNHVHPFHAHL